MYTGCGNDSSSIQERETKNATAADAPTSAIGGSLGLSRGDRLVATSATTDRRDEKERGEPHDPSLDESQQDLGVEDAVAIWVVATPAAPQEQVGPDIGPDRVVG